MREVTRMDVEVITDDRAFAGLETEWTSLLADTPAVSGFQSFAWIAACRSALASAERSLFVLVMRDGSETVGIVPAERRRGGELRFIGDAVSNYLGPVYKPLRLPGVVRALGTVIESEPRISMVDFRGLRESSPFLTALRALRPNGWSEARVFETGTCPYVDVSPGWGALASSQKSRTRGQLARKWKALEGLGQVEFTEVGEPDAVQFVLPVMFELFTRRWEGRHESGGFARWHRRFHEHAAPALAAAGHVRVSLLKLDGAVIAFTYGVRAQGVTSSYVLAHDDTLAVCSPGLLLLARLLEAACQRGDAEYDFSLGQEGYKDMWATGTRRVFRVLRWRSGSAAAVRGHLRGLGTRAWVTARSLRWLRQLRRNGLRPFIFGAPGLESRADSPGLPAGGARSWNISRVAGIAGGAPGVSVGRWAYARMVRELSPRLLALAVDRNFRGDTLLAVSDGGRFLGLVWRAGSARRSVVAAGHEIAATDPVYYHPIAVPGSDLETLVHALRRTSEGFVLVSEGHLPDGVATHLGTLPADLRFSRAARSAARPAR
jgi:CelD/BcsL family acetyltransferase involved in cellulose biosynthesis